MRQLRLLCYERRFDDRKLCQACFSLQDYPQAFAERREQFKELVLAVERRYDRGYRTDALIGIVKDAELRDLLIGLWYPPDSCVESTLEVALLIKGFRQGSARKVAHETDLQALREPKYPLKRIKSLTKYRAKNF